MPTTITLPPDLAERLNALVAGGAAPDVLSALRAAEEAYDADDSRRIEAIRSKVARAISDPRPPIPAEVVFDRIFALIDRVERQ